MTNMNLWRSLVNILVHSGHFNCSPKVAWEVISIHVNVELQMRFGENDLTMFL